MCRMKKVAYDFMLMLFFFLFYVYKTFMPLNKHVNHLHILLIILSC